MFGSSNTFDVEKDIPDLSGKVYVLTGGSSGIGYGIAAHILSHKPAALYILGKTPAHLEETHSSLSSWGDTSVVHIIQCDLTSLTATSTVANKLLSTLPRLDGLILNAGLGVGPYSLTDDNLDSHMQVNHISQFHLAMSLLPLLSSTPSSRLVLQSSEFHRFDTKSTFTSVSELNTDIGPMNLYARTKLAQLLFTHALVRRKRSGALPGVGAEDTAGPVVIACHPGGVKTDQQDQAVQAYGTLGKIGVKLARPLLKDPVDEGCKPVLFAVTAEEVQRNRADWMGTYVVPDRKKEECSKHARDEEVGEALWKLTEEIVLEKLGRDGVGYKTFFV